MSSLHTSGKVCPGYGIASKDSVKTQELVSNVYPDKRKVVVDKTVFRQFPFFIEAGVEGIAQMYPGTINVDISPKEFSVRAPDYKVTCEWIDGVEETFWLTRVALIYKEKEYTGYIYFPCISEQHVARNSMVEIIAERIEGIAYGDSVDVVLNAEKVLLSE